ncbi:integrase catalytic domain-containing protein, partial [Nephila pilipes]
NDRNYLRFLWWQDGDPNIVKIYRYCRVVFSIKSSPFLLGDTLDYHLDRVSDDYKSTAQLLKKSMYADNCVASVANRSELIKFIEESKEIMALGKFDLHGWQHNSFDASKGDYESQNAFPVLQDIPVLDKSTVNAEKKKIGCYLLSGAQAKKMDQTSRMTQPIQTTRRGCKVKAVQRLNLGF